MTQPEEHQRRADAADALWRELVRRGDRQGSAGRVMLEIPRQALGKWAAGKPTIKALYVFGSYARGEARPTSDLDLAIDFVDVDDPL